MEDKVELIKKVIGQKQELEDKLIEQITISPTGKQTFAALPDELQKALLAKMTAEQRGKIVGGVKIEG